MTDCLFCKMIKGDIKPHIVHEDDELLAFHDINPQAPVHVLIVPRRHVSTINDLTAADSALIGKMLMAAKEIAAREHFADTGYRVVMNCNEDGGQSVFHIHMHLLGGRGMAWPPG